MDSSSEFISLESHSLSSSRRRIWTRSGATSAANSAAGSRRTRRAGEAEFSSGKIECFNGHCLRSMRKNVPPCSDSSFDKSMEILSENVSRRQLMRQLDKPKPDQKKDCKEVPRTLKTRADAKAAEQVHEENRDLEVRRSCRLRQSPYTSANQSALFDKLITNTAEAVLQKMDDMEEMRRRRMLAERGASRNGKENRTRYSRGRERVRRADEEDNQASSDESEEKEDDVDTQKRYYFRQRKTVERYQAPLERPRQRKTDSPSRSPPLRERSSCRSSQSRDSSCRTTDSVCRRRRSVSSNDSTSSDDEEPSERCRKNRKLRCLPLNFQKEDLKGIRKDRMKIGASLGDVDPMQIDCSVRFDGVGGLSDHISALKEMVVFPLVYPEVFERFKIQPPRGCLFYGPPGTGKTLVARALANECSQGDRRIAFFMRKGADCLSKWVGESERQLRLLFDQAYRMRPSIIFFDEIDGLAPVRSSKQDQIHSSIVSTLLALMDGLDQRGEIVVIGATNRLDAIDPALRRPGRFDREFLFSLPNKEARKEIFKIHTRDWTPKPLDTFLEELAEKCVGYCGADVKSLCTEAALCALRRRYPQIYGSSEKLQLDVASIKITAQDFVTAMQKTVPASQRALASPGRALSPVLKPLLGNTLARILKALQREFPHAELALKKDQQQDIFDHAIDSDEESPSIFEDQPSHKMPERQWGNFLNFSRNPYSEPTSCRPRLLLVGEPGHGQASHLASAVIHALEKFPVYTLDLSILCVNLTSPEETCAQLMREAQRTAPSIIYIPHIHLWWEAIGATVKAAFTALLENIPAFAPVLLLATSNVCHADLPKEVQDLFINDNEVFQIELPNEGERRMFFEDLIMHQVAKPPASKTRAASQPLEVLPVAPPPKPQELTEEEIRQLEEHEEDTLRELRIFLRDVIHRLIVDRRFKAFTKPVDPEEVPDYTAVIKQPMDLSAILSKIDLHQYLTAKDFLKDIDLICSNALEYNPDKDPGDRLIRHRACALRDIAYSIVREEMDEDFERRCEEIQESRKERGCSSSKYAPSYCHVLPEESSVPGCVKTDPKCSEKTKMPTMPIYSSTPRSKEMTKRKGQKNRWFLNTAKKKRAFQFNKENRIPEEQDEGDSDEAEPTQDYSVEENENILQERQQNERVLLASKSAHERKRARCPEHSDPGKDSDVSGCQITESSEDGDSNESWVRCAKRVRLSRPEEQQVMSGEKAGKIPTQRVIVDDSELAQLLHFVTVSTRSFNIFQLEKLHAVLSQCLYQHREDHDKTELVKKMKKEISAFRDAQ